MSKRTCRKFGSFLKKVELNSYWETIVLSIIGEMLEPEENGDEICGAVMSKRKTGDRIAVWNRRNNQPHLIMAMGKVRWFMFLHVSSFV